MSEDTIKTKKKDKNMLKTVGGAALAVGGAVFAILAGLKKN